MIDVLFLVLPGSLLLDIAGPAEAFRLANQQLRKRGRDEMFRLRYAGPVAEAASSVGLVLAALEPLPETLRPPTWVVLLGRPGEAPDVVRGGSAHGCRRATGWRAAWRPSSHATQPHRPGRVALPGRCGCSRCARVPCWRPMPAWWVTGA
jgi:hypothetical protein